MLMLAADMQPNRIFAQVVTVTELSHDEFIDGQQLTTGLSIDKEGLGLVMEMLRMEVRMECNIRVILSESTSWSIEFYLQKMPKLISDLTSQLPAQVHPSIATTVNVKQTPSLD